MFTPLKKLPTVGIVSLGCPKNLVDTEVMLGYLKKEGMTLAGPDESRVVIVNTCGFIDQAKEESVEAILEQVRRKVAGEIDRVIVAGCMVQKYGAELAAEIPEVDHFLGLDELVLCFHKFARPVLHAFFQLHVPLLQLLAHLADLGVKLTDILILHGIRERDRHRDLDLSKELNFIRPIGFQVRFPPEAHHSDQLTSQHKRHGDHPLRRTKELFDLGSERLHFRIRADEIAHHDCIFSF